MMIIRFFSVVLDFVSDTLKKGVLRPLISVGILSVRLPICPGGSVSYCNDSTALSGFSLERFCLLRQGINPFLLRLRDKNSRMGLPHTALTCPARQYSVVTYAKQHRPERQKRAACQAHFCADGCPLEFLLL